MLHVMDCGWPRKGDLLNPDKDEEKDLTAPRGNS